MSSRLKSHSKKTPERSRTPGRPSPESQSAQGSPRDDSPPDTVFPSEDVEDKKPENNSNSNEGTLVGPANSDETIVATDYRKSKSDSRLKRSKSTLSSRASTPGPMCEIHHAEVQILPSNEILEVVGQLESKQLDHLELPKPKEKSPSPFNRQNSPQDFEEPSFANTLDDIATMGTNEVADLDPYMDERPFSALPVNIDDIQQFIPTVQYIEPSSQKEELKETAIVSEHENYIVEKANENSIKIEINKDNGELNFLKKSKTLYNLQTNDKSYESVQEPVDDVVAEAVVLENEINVIVKIDPSPEYNVDGAKDPRSDIKSTEIDVLSTNIHQMESMEVEPVVSNSFEDINRVESGAYGSAEGTAAENLERQFTPLSFSSSDAAFYSPTDSPDESLSEKLKEIPNGSQTQVNITNSIHIRAVFTYSNHNETQETFDHNLNPTNITVIAVIVFSGKFNRLE